VTARLAPLESNSDIDKKNRIFMYEGFRDPNAHPDEHLESLGIEGASMSLRGLSVFIFPKISLL